MAQRPGLEGSSVGRDPSAASSCPVSPHRVTKGLKGLRVMAGPADLLQAVSIAVVVPSSELST